MSVAVLAIISTTVEIEVADLEHHIRQSVIQTLATPSFPLTPSDITLTLMQGSQALLASDSGIAPDLVCKVSAPISLPPESKARIETQVASRLYSQSELIARVTAEGTNHSILAPYWREDELNKLDGPLVEEILDGLHSDTMNVLMKHYAT